MSTKKKIVIFSLMAAGVIALVYYTFTTTHNAAILTAMPIVLALVPCLVMCGAIGGSMWLLPRLSKNKHYASCSCGMHDSASTKEDVENLLDKN